MVVFVDLDEDGRDPPHLEGGRLVWSGAPSQPAGVATDASQPPDAGTGQAVGEEMEAHEPPVAEYPNQNSMTEALGCYP